MIFATPAKTETRQLEDLQILRTLFDTGHSLAALLPGGIDDVTVHAVLERSGIAKLTATRAFAIGPITDDLLRDDLRLDVSRLADLGKVLTAMHSVMTDGADHLASNDPVRLAYLLRELARQALDANLSVLASRKDWRVSPAERQATSRAQDAELLERFRRLEDVGRTRLTDLYRSVNATFGIRPREPMTIEEFTDTAACALEGVVMMERTGQLRRTLMRPTGPNGELREWSTAAVMFEGLVLASLEPDPWVEVAADLSTWR